MRTGATSAVARGCPARTRSASSRGCWRGSVAATPASPTSSPQELSADAAVREADTLLLTVPNQLGVEYNAQMLETIARHIAPAIGWEPALTA